jgi:hypothetical protein
MVSENSFIFEKEGEKQRRKRGRKELESGSD